MTGAEERDLRDRYGEDVARAIHDEELDRMRALPRRPLSDVWCALCDQPAVVERREATGETVALCDSHDASSPCDDCGRYVGHLDVEH